MTPSFALLAPVPLIHLESALTIADEVPYVCFGSDLFHFFRSVDQDRGGADVPILLCATENQDSSASYIVKYFGWYVGAIEDATLQRVERKDGRIPPSARENRAAGIATEDWAVLYCVRDLRALAQHEVIRIDELTNAASGSSRALAAVRQPQRVSRPHWI